MKLGLYGGSFDPIHHGHLRPVREAITAVGLDRVIYLPTAQPPHKERRMAPAEARYAMVEMALLGEADSFASPFEMRAGASYTIDTLHHFRQQQPDDEIFLIVGGDSFVALPSWRRWREILEVVELIVLERPGTDVAAADLAPELREALATGRAHLISNLPVAVSSTEVRRAVAVEDATVADLVPKLVLDYIFKYGLYRER